MCIETSLASSDQCRPQFSWSFQFFDSRPCVCRKPFKLWPSLQSLLLDSNGYDSFTVFERLLLPLQNRRTLKEKKNKALDHWFYLHWTIDGTVFICLVLEEEVVGKRSTNSSIVLVQTQWRVSSPSSSHNYNNDADKSANICKNTNGVRSLVAISGLSTTKLCTSVRQVLLF